MAHASTLASLPTGRSTHRVSAREAALVGGIASSLLYVAMNIFVARQWPAYSSVSQTVSELSAVDAPTRPLWIPLGVVYALLVTGFGWGVWVSASNSRALRISGGLLTVYGALGLAWPLAPMHLREVLAAGGGTVSDTMHLVFAAVTVALMLLAMGFAAAALGKRFRLYSIVTIGVLAAFGMATGMEASKVGENLPTPWVGVWERINIGVFLLWVVVLAVALLSRRTPAPGTR